MHLEERRYHHKTLFFQVQQFRRVRGSTLPLPPKIFPRWRQSLAHPVRYLSPDGSRLRKNRPRRAERGEARFLRETRDSESANFSLLSRVDRPITTPIAAAGVEMLMQCRVSIDTFSNRRVLRPRHRRQVSTTQQDVRTRRERERLVSPCPSRPHVAPLFELILLSTGSRDRTTLTHFDTHFILIISRRSPHLPPPLPLLHLTVLAIITHAVRVARLT